MRISKKIISLIVSISVLGAMALNVCAEKQMAFDEDCSQKKIINELLREGIDRKKGQTRLDEI